MDLRKLAITLLTASTLTLGTMQTSNAGVIALVTSPYGLLIAAGAATITFTGGLAYMPGSMGLKLLVAGGLLILDKDTNQVKFVQLSEQDAQRLNISKAELNAFNQEIDRVNAAAEEVNAQFSSLSDEEKSSTETAAQLREALKAEISENAFSAVSKIVKSAK